MKTRKTTNRRSNLEMITKLDAEGYVLSIEFVRNDGSSDKINIEREMVEEEEA